MFCSCIRLLINSAWLCKYCSCTLQCFSLVLVELCHTVVKRLQCGIDLFKRLWRWVAREQVKFLLGNLTKQAGIFAVIRQELVVGFQRFVLPGLKPVKQLPRSFVGK